MSTPSLTSTNPLLLVVAGSSWPLRLINLRVWVNCPLENLLVTAHTENNPLKPGTTVGISIVAPFI